MLRHSKHYEFREYPEVDQMLQVKFLETQGKRKDNGIFLC